MQDPTKPTKSIPVTGRPNSPESWVRLQVSNALREEIRPLVDLYAVRPETLDKAFEEALSEMDGGTKPGESYEEELRSGLLGIVLYKLFVTKSPLWITSRTARGNEVPVELLVPAYAVWRKAEAFAARCHVDAAAAAEALAEATHAVADGVARNGWRDRKGKEIQDVRGYLFETYGNRIFTIAREVGSFRTESVDMGDWLAGLQLSDRGVVLNALETGIFCRELMDSMPPRGRSVAVARYIIGYNWPETAEALGISINAAQKALSVGFKKVLGICMREFQRARGRKSAEPKAPKREKHQI